MIIYLLLVSDGGAWDQASPLLLEGTKKMQLSGVEDSTASMLVTDIRMKNCLVTKEVMECGKHRISFKPLLDNCMCDMAYVGVVRDGAPWNKNMVRDRDNTGVWWLSYIGTLSGNNKCDDDDDKIHGLSAWSIRMSHVSNIR